MTISRNALRGIYAAIAVLAFFGLWAQNVVYFPLGFWGSQGAIWRESVANPAARANTVDLTFFGLAVFIWMLLEARRLHMRGIWIYALFFMIVGISISVPVFLYNRQRALEAQEGGPIAGTITKADAGGVIFGALLVIGWAIAMLYLTYHH
jgi:hypothetical protein